jgi:putative redox protein
MDVEKVVLNFEDGFKGGMTAPGGSVPIGMTAGGMAPYNLLFGALGSCFYSTFLSIATKKRLTFTKAELEITGHKRDEVPPTLDHVEIKMTVTGASDEQGIKRSVELGAQYCSVHATISKVAEIKIELLFA